MKTVGRIAPWLCLVLTACGGASPTPPAAPAAAPARQETVFDDLVEKKREIPAAVEATQEQHVEDTKRQIEAAEGR
jgi:hypothetical protein